MTVLWSAVALAAAVVAAFAWAVRMRSRHVQMVPDPTASQIGQALARFSLLHRMFGWVAGIALGAVLNEVWHGISSNEWLGVPIAAMGVVLAGLVWALTADAKVRCAEMGIPDPARTNRLLGSSSASSRRRPTTTPRG